MQMQIRVLEELCAACSTAKPSPGAAPGSSSKGEGGGRCCSIIAVWSHSLAWLHTAVSRARLLRYSQGAGTIHITAQSHSLEWLHVATSGLEPLQGAVSLSSGQWLGLWCCPRQLVAQGICPPWPPPEYTTEWTISVIGTKLVWVTLNRQEHLISLVFLSPLFLELVALSNDAICHVWRKIMESAIFLLNTSSILFCPRAQPPIQHWHFWRLHLWCHLHQQPHLQDPQIWPWLCHQPDSWAQPCHWCGALPPIQTTRW